VDLANIDFYGPILAALATTIVALGAHIRSLHNEAQASGRAHAAELKALGETHAATLKQLVDEYTRRLEQQATVHAAKLDEIGAHRAEQAREMVETLLSIQESRAEEQRALNTTLNALEATLTAVKDIVTQLSERTFDHLIARRRPSPGG